MTLYQAILSKPQNRHQAREVYRRAITMEKNRRRNFKVNATR